MENLREPPPPTDEDSDGDDLFSSPTTDAIDNDEEVERVNVDKKDNKDDSAKALTEDKLSPDSGCESATVDSLIGDSEVKSVPVPSKEPQESILPSYLTADALKGDETVPGSSIKPPEKAQTGKDEEIGDDYASVIEILVSDPKKIGDGMNAYVVYKVTTRTNVKIFRSCEMTVTRRFSDFLGLHERLVETYQCRGKVVPQPPEKSVLGMTKVKMTKDETGSLDFVEKRRAALERFLNRIAQHPDLRGDRNFIDFLEVDGDLPKSSTTSALSSAGIARLFGKVGDSINKIAFTLSEPDQWFEDKQEQIESLDHELKQLHSSLETLVVHRRELSQNIGQFAKSIAVLGSVEENMALSKALSALAEIETKVEQIVADQADADFFVLSELVKDYINLIQSVKDTLNERMKLYRLWKDAEATLAKKQEAKAKLEQQRKLDKVDLAEQEIQEWEQRVTKTQEGFEEISKTIRKELAHFERQKVRDFKATILNYLQTMMNNQQQLATYWESFIPEAKQIV